MELIKEDQFKAPYPQEALSGEPGLTSEDIANSQGMRHQDFKRNLKEHGYLGLLTEAGMGFARFRAKPTQVGGRPRELLVFPSDTAKVLLAQSRTAIGISYAAWLIRLESAAVKMAAAIKDHREQIVELRAENEKLKAQKEPRKNRHALEYERTTKTLFGEEVELVKKRAYLSEMAPQEKQQWRALHLTKIAKGAAEASIAEQTRKTVALEVKK